MPTSDDLYLSELEDGAFIEFMVRAGSNKSISMSGWFRSLKPHGENHYLLFERNGKPEDENNVLAAVLVSDIWRISTRRNIKPIVRRPEDLYEELHNKLGDQK